MKQRCLGDDHKLVPAELREAAHHCLMALNVPLADSLYQLANNVESGAVSLEDSLWCDI